MSNGSKEKNLDQNILSYLSAQTNWRSNRGDVQSLMRKLNREQAKRK